ncbi:MAG: RNase A-like domain-containing protein [Acidobacteriota bacterium]
MPSDQHAPRSRVPLWLVLLVLGGVTIWQYARAPHESLPSAPPQTSAPATPASAPQPSSESRHDLSVDERRGGHTLARHVGQTDADLADRLDHERGISAASTYTDRVAAERTVARALAMNERRIQTWRTRSGNHPNLALDYRGTAGDTIGRSLARGRQSAVPCVDAIVVLRWRERDDYYVLTSYPEARR